MADLRSDRGARDAAGHGRDQTGDSPSISWLRYVWIAFAAAIGVAVVGYGALALALTDVCESNCGTAWPWVFIAVGAATIVAALVDAERTFRRNRRACPRRHRDPATDLRERDLP